jgi:hypothetical protein
MCKAALPFRQTAFSTAPQEHRKEALLLEKRREHSLMRQEQRPKAHGLRTLRRIPLRPEHQAAILIPMNKAV